MAQEPVTIYPISLDKSPAENLTDFRPKILPADAEVEDEERPDPKASSAPEPADSSESPKQTEPTQPETPAQHPAGKGNTLAKGLGTGKQTSS